MPRLKIFFGTVYVLAVAILVIAFKPGKKNQKKAEKDNSFAIVELFTSEGCSSCPPADEVLNDIVENARVNDRKVYALAFHVDYWNDLGWKDIYSRAEYSQRQRNYARALKSSVYTPQMIINGKKQFVGSNEVKAQRSIKRSLVDSAVASVDITKLNYLSTDEINIEYSTEGVPTGAILNIALVERGIIRKIKDGENTGRMLHHENVVRAYRSIDLNRSNGSVSLQLSDDVDEEQASIIAYIQDADTKQIYGAEGIDVK